jgi:HEAT repeat protein
MSDDEASATDLRAVIDRWASLVKATSDDPPDSIVRPPASQAAIAALEARIGTTLPPSYRAFLAISDGAAAFPAWGLVAGDPDSDRPGATGLRDTATVDWIRNGDRLTVSLWSEIVEPSDDPDDHPLYVARVPEREYLVDGFVEHPEGGSEKGGHLRHVLEISTNVDGYATYLNPLVVDADGEWEAWDFGVKTLGGIRYASFRDLLEADSAQLEVRIKATDDVDETAQFAELEDRTRPPQERVMAAYGLFGPESNNERIAAAVGEIAIDPDVERQVRQSAIQVLGYTQTAAAIATMARLVTDPDVYVRMATIGPLTASTEPIAVPVTRTVLTDPTIMPMAFGGIWRCNEGVWEAWQERRHPLLLAALARCGDTRAIEPLAEALRDPDLPDDERGPLVSSASYQFRGDPLLIAAVMAASTFQIAHSRVHTAGTLLGLGATDAAITMYRDAAIELGIGGWGQSESALGRLTEPAAGDALLAIVAANPTAAAIDALGWHPSPAAVDAVVPWLDDPATHLAAIDALERMNTPSASDALADRSAAGDVLATRALARLRDGRALAPLLTLLASADPATAFRGADGLRDLRDPTATEPLLAAVDHPDPDVAVCSAHALISMASPRTPEALSRLSTSPDPQAHALAAHWEAAWTRRAVMPD